MRILVLGAGGTGGYFGGRLVQAGVDVTFLVRPARAALLGRQGLVIRSPLGDASFPVRTVTRADDHYDAVLLSCKAYDLDSAMGAIAPAVGPETLVLPLLNGLRHFDVLDERFGRGRVLGGLCHIGVTLADDGAIEHLNTLQRLALGAREPSQQAGAAALHAVLARGGFRPVLAESVMQELWDKFVFLASAAGMTTLMRASIGAILAAQEGQALMLEMLECCRAVAAANGYAPGEKAWAWMVEHVSDRQSTSTSSMLRDMRRNGPIEHGHIIGDMLERARAVGVPAPLLRVSLAHLQAYEALRTGAAR